MRARGFTLLELLVVIGIFGFVSVMAYGGLASVLKSRARIEASLDRTAETQKAFQRLRSDFQQVRARPVRDVFGELQAAVFGVPGQGISLTRAGWRNPLGLPRPALERITYRIEEEQLVRESWRALDVGQDAKPVKAVLLTGVQEARARYLDPSREWVEQWPPQSATGGTPSMDAPPPLAIEMTLLTQDLGELRFLFRLGLDPLPANFIRGQTIQTPSTGTPAPANNNSTTNNNANNPNNGDTP